MSLKHTMAVSFSWCWTFVGCVASVFLLSACLFLASCPFLYLVLLASLRCDYALCLVLVLLPPTSSLLPSPVLPPRCSCLPPTIYLLHRAPSFLSLLRVVRRVASVFCLTHCVMLLFPSNGKQYELCARDSCSSLYNLTLDSPLRQKAPSPRTPWIL